MAHSPHDERHTEFGATGQFEVTGLFFPDSQLDEQHAAQLGNDQGQRPKHLILVGAGAAHLHVLAHFAQHPRSDVKLTLVAAHQHVVHEPLLPLVMSGELDLACASIDLALLAERAGAIWHQAACSGIDSQASCIMLDHLQPAASGYARTITQRPTLLSYDLLSLDMDPVFERKHLDALIAGAFAHGVPIKPAGAAIERWNQLVAHPPVDSDQPVQVAVLGAVVQAVELAFAVQQRLQSMGAKHRVVLGLGGCDLLANATGRLRAKVIQRLEDAGIDIHSDRCVGMQAQALYFANGQALTCHMALLVDGCHAPAWLCYSGLALDSNGRVLVNAKLKSVSSANVFASGALAAWQGQTSLAVDSMDAGQTLALNLMAALSQLPLESHAPSRKWHQSIYTTKGQAIGCAGPVVFEHAWLAHQKRKHQLQWVRLNAFNSKAG